MNLPFHVDQTIHVGDVVVTIATLLMGWLGRGLLKSYKAVSQFVTRVERMDFRVEEIAGIVDIHTDLHVKSGWARGIEMEHVSQKRRSGDRNQTLGLGLVLLSVMITHDACGPVPPPTPPTPPAPTVRAVSLFVYDLEGRPVVGASCKLDTDTELTNADGYVLWTASSQLRNTQVDCTRDGYYGYSGIRTLATGTDEWLPNVTMLTQHLDPSLYTPEQLLTFRGSLFTVRAGDCQLPYGPRPGQPDNVAFFAADFYTKEQRECVYQLWKARGYTHGAVGPFIDSGYHGQTPPVDFRGDPDHYADLLQEVWDHGLIPVVFVTPDGWTVDQLRTLEPIFRSPRWQALVRVVVNGFEQQGSTYGWSNNTYAGHLAWLRDTFPNAVRGLHTIADIESPVGDGDETDAARCTTDQVALRKCFHGNGDAWARIAPLIHFWLHQSSALFTPDHLADNGRADFLNWLALWDKRDPASFPGRFGQGTAGWPTTSARGGPLCVVAGEYLSYKVYWDPSHFTEDMARDWGARALSLGSCGYMDGGR